MSDERIIEYLRDRGRTDVPSGFVSSVMSAVEAAPPPRSWFAAHLPAVAAVAAVALVAALALVLGPGRTVGPAPTSSPAPTSTTTAGTVEELHAELTAAVEALRAAPGVRGQQSASLRDSLGSATWFDWRANGDHVVVTRTDLDVTQTGWWMDPFASPPANGERVGTWIAVSVGDRYLESGRHDGWDERPRVEAPRIVSYGTGILTGEIDPAEPLTGLVLGSPNLSAGTLERRAETDGRITWTAETPWREGTVIQRWRIAAGGSLQAWTWDAVGVRLDPDGAFNGNVTSAVLEFEVLTDPAPIPVPDLGDIPDASDFGLPADFPLPAVVVPRPSAEPAAVTDEPTCRHPSGAFEVTLPTGWWTNTMLHHPALGVMDTCRFLGPEPFDPLTATPDRPVPGGVSLTLDYVAGGCIGFINAALSQRELEIDGWPATATEFAQGKEATNPPGHYQYVINLRPDVDCESGGAFIVGRTSVDMAGSYEENKLLLDEVMAPMQVTFQRENEGP